MKQNLPAVRCVYGQTPRSLEELLEESFRLYLLRTVVAPEKSGAQPLG